MNQKRIYFLIMIFVVPVIAKAQYTFFRPKGSFAIETSLENSKELRLPIYRNAMSSLAVSGDFILGGTTADSGLSPFIFTGSVSKQKLVHTKSVDDVIKDQSAISTGFSGPSSGDIFYAGTMPKKGSSASGHIIEVKLKKDGSTELKDLGIPVAGEGVFALVYHAAASRFYGIAHPSGKFFSHDLKTGKTETYDQTATTANDLHRYHEFAVTAENYLCRALVVDARGKVYGSKAINKLFVFDPANKSFTVFKDELPFVWGREAIGRIDSWVTMPDGAIYGSNAADGNLFRLDPVKQKMINLGKPVMMPRIMAMTPGKNRMLYGIAGGAPGYSHLFSYHPEQGFRDLGNPEFPMVAPGIEQGINWRGFQISTIASSKDGKQIVMGENEALSQLMVFPAENLP